MGKTAIIINFDSLVGQECAISMVHQGYDIVLHAYERSVDVCLLEGLLHTLGGETFLAITEEFDAPAARELARQTVERFGRADLIIVNSTVDIEKLETGVFQDIERHIRRISARVVQEYLKALLEALGEGDGPEVCIVAPKLGIYGAPSVVPYFENHHAMRRVTGRLARRFPAAEVRLVDPNIISTALDAEKMPWEDAGIKAKITHKSDLAAMVLGCTDPDDNI